MGRVVFWGAGKEFERLIDNGLIGNTSFYIDCVIDSKRNHLEKVGVEYQTTRMHSKS